ncbi:unnamed protein product [Arabis nemorensis]|uniref:Pectinesterase n=1 Tax=Arabis nemorensis TaxID=586526 RepID=A0A565BH58_9BRAS|nr:unnamed protein product [Arabis nemorensis]
MDLKSIKEYFKVDSTQDFALRRQTRNRRITLALLIALLIIIGGCIGAFAHSRKNNSKPSSTPELTPAASLKSVCSVTQFPDACISSISKIPSSSNTTDPESLFKLSLKVVVDELGSISGLPKTLSDASNDERVKSALGVCGDLIQDSIDQLVDTVAALEEGGDVKTILNAKKLEDVKTWLSAALTFHETCFDTLDEVETEYTESLTLKSAMKNSTEYTSNSLAIVAKVLSFGVPQRRLLNSHPSWVRPTVRRLLEEKRKTPDITVAADGSGDVKTITEAVAKIPSKSKTRFHIYVKSGTYLENVVLDKSKWNVMMYGDGNTETIISGSKSNGTGSLTFLSATFAVQGEGFIMKDIGIINTAGPKNGQAVALKSGSDFSVFYRCSFEGYQDTLYPHSHRQFYRDCDITGTVDFIFGNAAVVFQGCNIRPRQPLPGQFNTITAQGKTDTNQNTGISIQYCTISGANGDVTAATYLGRPWKKYSKTVVMQSKIGSVVSPAGWTPWGSEDPPSTIFYGEYKNSGPGSDLTQRVKWVGYTPVMTDIDVWHVMVYNFIQGMEWIEATGVPFDPK